MAVTTIHPIKSTLKKALDYITDPQKTEEKLLVSSYGCSVETADIEMEFTLNQCYQKGNNLAHHLIQSFEPGEVSYEATVKNLNALKTDGKKLPPYKELRKQYEQITAEKDKLYQEYRKLNQKVRQHETVRANLEQIIRPEPEKDRGKEKESSIQI